MREACLEVLEIGVKTGSKNVDNIRYANNTTLLAKTKDDLKHLILTIQKESEKMGLHLNIKTTKIMSTAGSSVTKVTNQWRGN